MNRTNAKTLMTLSLFLGLATPHLSVAQEPVSTLQQANKKVRVALSTLRKGIVDHKRKVGAGVGVLALLLASVIYRAGGVRNAAAKYNITPLFDVMARRNPDAALLAAATFKKSKFIGKALAYRANPSDLKALIAYCSASNVSPATRFYQTINSHHNDAQDSRTLSDILKLGFPLNYTMRAELLGSALGEDTAPTDMRATWPITDPIGYGKFQCARVILESIKPELYPFVEIQGRHPLIPGRWLLNSLQEAQLLIQWLISPSSGKLKSWLKNWEAQGYGKYWKGNEKDKLSSEQLKERECELHDLLALVNEKIEVLNAQITHYPLTHG